MTSPRLVRPVRRINLEPHIPEHRDFRALSSFASGYLHEDFVKEHDSAEGALRAFGRNATADDRRRLRKDGKRFLALTADWPWRDVRRAFLGLGSTWAPRSRPALHLYFKRFARAK